MKKEAKKKVPTREDLWNTRCDEIWQFIKKNHRGPSRHHPEEHQLLNWMKFNRKTLNKGKMPENRKIKFKKLTEYLHTYHSINQYI